MDSLSVGDLPPSGIRPHLPLRRRFKGFLEPLVRRRCFFQERVEIVRWVAIFQHPFERRIGIRLAAVGAQGLVVVHPGHHDDLRVAVEPVEQPILLEEFRPEPVLAVIAECAALPEGRGTRICRYGLGHQLEDGGQPFRGIFLAPGLGIARLTRLDLFKSALQAGPERADAHKSTIRLRQGALGRARYRRSFILER